MPRSDKTKRTKVIYLRIQALENDWQKVRIGIDLELQIRREGEVGRGPAELCRDGLIKPACGGCKRVRPIGGEARYAWDDKGKDDSDTAKERWVGITGYAWCEGKPHTQRRARKRGTRPCGG